MVGIALNEAKKRRLEMDSTGHWGILVLHINGNNQTILDHRTCLI